MDPTPNAGDTNTFAPAIETQQLCESGTRAVDPPKYLGSSYSIASNTAWIGGGTATVRAAVNERCVHKGLTNGGHSQLETVSQFVS